MGVAPGEGETGSAFAGARRGVDETRDTFAGGKWLEFGWFVRAKVSSVSNVCGEELAVVPAVSSSGSDPPALVLSVSGEVVGGCCEVAVAPIGVKKLAQQAWILGETEKKFALLAKKGRFWGGLALLGEFFPAWVLMGPSRASFVPPGGRDGTGMKEKPPLREVLWGAVKYSSPLHAEKCSILPILSEQGRYFFH